MARAKKIGFWGLAALMTAPVVAYFTARIVNAANSWWKTGWESRPFIYISTSGILIYVLYVAGALAALAWLWKTTQDRFVAICAIVLLLMLVLYWLGFLTWSVGVLPSKY